MVSKSFTCKKEKERQTPHYVIRRALVGHYTYILSEWGRGAYNDPKDFSVITGLPVCGKSLIYNMEAHTNTKEVVRLFGNPIANIINIKIKYKYIMDKYKEWKP